MHTLHKNKKGHIMKKLIAFIAVMFLTGFCLAYDVIELEPIVITPYKVAVSSSINPSSTDVLDVEKLNKKGVFGLTKSLSELSSVAHATTGGLGGVTGVSIRGANPHHTQVLIDDIKLYDPIVTSAYFYAYNYMSLDNLQRIEVSKGPFSPLYGSDSIGGTIQLITKKGEGKPKFSYTQEFGSYQTAREKLSSDGQVGKLAYSVSISRADVNMFYSTRYKEGNDETDPYQNLNSSVRLDYSLTDNTTIGLLADYTYAKYEYDGDSGWPLYMPADDDDNYAYFYQGVGAIKFDQQLTDSFSHKARLGYTRTYRKNWESRGNDSWYNGKTYQAKWQGNYQPCSWDQIVFGFDYLRELGESRFFSTFWNAASPKTIANTKGYYIENILTPIENLFIAGAYRIEDHSIYNRHNTFSVSGSYLIEQTNTKIKASYGEGFKAPSLFQLFDTFWGNRNLNPEESESYEAGFEQELFDSFRFGSTFFHTRMSNLIDWTPTGYVNSGAARMQGIESFIEYMFNENTSLKVSHTHMEAERLFDKMRLLRRPNNKVVCQFKTTLDKLSIFADISYVGNRVDTTTILKPYVLANAAFNYQANDNVEVFLRFENILNERYELVDSYQTPKFSWYLGAKITFP